MFQGAKTTVIMMTIIRASKDVMYAISDRADTSQPLITARCYQAVTKV